MRKRILCLLLITVPVAGCVSTEQKKSAIAKVDAEFRRCYEEILEARGDRYFPVPTDRALERATVALETLGMTIVRADAMTGTVRGQAPAPAPLSAAEWNQAVARDLPRFREIIAGEVGLLGWFVNFEPAGLDVAITLTGTEAGPGTQMSATMRLVERAPPRSGYPRREYAPCSAVDMGIDKLWRTVARQM